MSITLLWFKSPSDSNSHFFVSISTPGPIHKCHTVGILFVPQGTDFRMKKSRGQSDLECQGSSGEFPRWENVKMRRCADKFTARLKTLFSMTVYPSMWWREDFYRSTNNERRHTVCYLSKSKLSYSYLRYHVVF